MKTRTLARRLLPSTARRSATLGRATVLGLELALGLGLACQVAWAHEGHGGFSELHAHGDTLWGLAALAVVVIVGWALGKRK